MRAARAVCCIPVLALGIVACSPQGVRPSEPDLPAASATQVLTVLAPTETPTSPTPTEVVGVTVSVTSDTNCRTGPAKAFDLIFTAHPGTEFNVVGKNTPTGYWIVEDPAGGTCWLWGEYAVVEGDISILAEYPSPPLPTPASTQTPRPTLTSEPTQTPRPTPTPVIAGSVPKAPKRLGATRRCASSKDSAGYALWIQTDSLQWDDNSSDEDGYRLYLNGVYQTTLPKDSSSRLWTWNIYKTVVVPAFDTYAVEAYNSAGASPRATTNVPRCE